MKRRGFLVVPFIALGIALAFLVYTILDRWTPPSSREGVLSNLPEKVLSECGGLFYTNYEQLKALSTSSPTDAGDFLNFSRVSAPYDLSTSLFRVFYLPDFAAELNLSYRDLKEVAWTPMDPIEVVRGSFDWGTLLKRLEEEGFTRREEGGAVFFDGVFDPASSLSIFGEIAQIEDFLIMEHYSQLKEYPVHREEVVDSIKGNSPSITQTDTWKDYSPFLENAPSFFLGPAPDLPDLEAQVKLNPSVTEENYGTFYKERLESLLSGDFLDFCAYSVLNDPGRVEFLLRYRDESSASQDLPKLKLALERSFSAVLPGTNYSSLLGDPQVSQEGKFLRVSAHAQTGIKVVQAMVQNQDFGFLFRLTAE
ncbi:MAG: hypothetical protein NUV68_01860 [Caldiserica bacterium]|jgi:hypothetical protein|nr:hypothetical protein [Caldisericota bacterium]MDH7562103.1 hypothetical protein [Caldisericota bacterium]